ncbi:MAG: hypothetical protein L6Q80_14825 [Dehalococcoidia bacterium]|nr:hypothetical protein [Dehalococcoidia bacterium]
MDILLFTSAGGAVRIAVGGFAFWPIVDFAVDALFVFYRIDAVASGGRFSPSKRLLRLEILDSDSHCRPAWNQGLRREAPLALLLPGSAYLRLAGTSTDPANVAIVACSLLWLGSWLAEEIFAMAIGAKSWRDRLSNTEVVQSGIVADRELAT